MGKFDSDVKIEKAMRYKGLEPVVKVEYESGTIYIGDGFVDKETAKKFRGDEYPNGYYQTMWIWKRDKAEFGNWAEFEPYHNFEELGLNQEKKQRARVNHAIMHAKQFIKKTGEPIVQER